MFILSIVYFWGLIDSNRERIQEKKLCSLEVYEVNVPISLLGGRGDIGAVWIGLKVASAFVLFYFFIFFHFTRFALGQGTIITVAALFIHYSSTVHEIHNHFIQKKILKIGLTILFTHLKIILLQYFQFSVLVKINSIQRDPYIKVGPSWKGEDGG